MNDIWNNKWGGGTNSLSNIRTLESYLDLDKYRYYPITKYSKEEDTIYYLDIVEDNGTYKLDHNKNWYIQVGDKIQFEESEDMKNFPNKYYPFLIVNNNVINQYYTADTLKLGLLAASVIPILDNEPELLTAWTCPLDYTNSLENPIVYFEEEFDYQPDQTFTYSLQWKYMILALMQDKVKEYIDNYDSINFDSLSDMDKESAFAQFFSNTAYAYQHQAPISYIISNSNIHITVKTRLQ